MSASNSSSDLAATIGRNVREARRAAGMTQYDLAVALRRGDAMTVSRWERGTHRPSDQNLVVLAEVLRQPVAWFYGESEQAA